MVKENEHTTTHGEAVDPASALLDLLADCFADEIAHLKLRLIRDAQAPRFAELKESHPEIYADFMAARNGPHETLLRNRRKRVEAITALIERSNAKDQTQPDNRNQPSKT